MHVMHKLLHNACPFLLLPITLPCTLTCLRQALKCRAWAHFVTAASTRRSPRHSVLVGRSRLSANTSRGRLSLYTVTVVVVVVIVVVVVMCVVVVVVAVVVVVVVAVILLSLSASFADTA